MNGTLARWDPFRDLMDIQSELNRLFGRTFTGSGSAADSGRSLATGAWVPPLDMFEQDDKLVVTLELPGIEPGKVEVEVEDSTLTVSGSREFSDEVKEENFHRVERRYGAFSRSIGLPSVADVERIDASFDKGVLRIEVPKREEAKPKRIQVKATG